MSEGEKVIGEYLRSHGFKYVGSKIDKEPNDLSSINAKNWFIFSYQPDSLQKLHLDYFIKYEGQYIGIEYDGRQHFSCDKYFYNDHLAPYQSRRECDRKKDMLCTISQWPLIRLEDIGDLVSSNLLKARPIIFNALRLGISKALYLSRHSHVFGVIKEPISWCNAYYDKNHKRIVIKECIDNAHKLLDVSNELSNNIHNLRGNFKRLNPRIRIEINKILLLVKSTIAKLGVLKPQLQEPLKCIENDIIMGLLQFYVHPSIVNNGQSLQYGSSRNNEYKLQFDNIDDELLTNRMISKFAKRTLADLKIINYVNYN